MVAGELTGGASGGGGGGGGGAAPSLNGFVERRQRQLLVEHHSLSGTQLDVVDASRSRTPTARR